MVLLWRHCIVALSNGGTLKKVYVAVVLALSLSGCSGGPQAAGGPGGASETGTPEASPTTTTPATTTPTTTTMPTSTPIVMSKDEAAKAYLAAVCLSNVQADKTTTVIQAKPLDLQAAKTEAGALRDAYRSAIEKLTDEKMLWPEGVKSDIASLADGMYEDVSGAQNVANQTTEGNLIAAWNGWITPPERAATAQKIRLKLGLSPDTTASCAK